VNEVSISTSFLAGAPRPGNVVFDLDGVIFLGSTTIDGAGDALAAIDAAGVRIVFATNNATRTVDYIVDRISRGTGYTPSPDQIVTSATTTAAFVSPEGGAVLVVGEQGLVATLESAGHAVTGDPDAAAVVVTGLDRSIDYSRIADAARAIRRGAIFIATNTDATFPTPDGPVPGAGTIVAALSTASGRSPSVMGKPHPPFLAALRSALGTGPTWMIGDRPETDLALGRAAGWLTVMTLTGVTTDPAAVPRHLAPDAVVGSVAELVRVFD
jgi:4-nitrophenyl phosphatase